MAQLSKISQQYGMSSDGDQIAAILGKASGFKLGRGVVGKTGQASLGVLAVWGIVLWRVGDNLITDGILVAGGLAATLFAIWFVRSTQAFATQNPALALLEGAELVAYKQLEMATAGLNAEDMKRVGNSLQPLLPREGHDDEG